MGSSPGAHGCTQVNAFCSPSESGTSSLAWTTDLQEGGGGLCTQYGLNVKCFMEQTIKQKHVAIVVVCVNDQKQYVVTVKTIAHGMYKTKVTYVSSNPTSYWRSCMLTFLTALVHHI